MTTNAVSGQTSAVNVAVPPSSLYVGDLHPDVTEAMLFEKFSNAGTVLSIRVCRDAVTRISLGYAYVNFQQHSDAERALKAMNFDSLMSKPIRIMWSQRDPTIRRSGSGNIFIKNLSKHIDTKSMYDTFSMFGNILSCKVASDLDGQSKGYGFIHFETEEAALKAIEKVNGMLLEGKLCQFVAKFLPRAARLRELGGSANRFNNIFVKNFAEHLDKEKLDALFEKFGKITSSVVMLDDEKKSRGFGFVCFENPEDAEKAVAEMNDYELPETDFKLTVCRAQKKSERQAELKRRREKIRMERQQRYQGVNLYVKNLENTITDETLRSNFEPFGIITSAKVMCDENGCSKGFGFVCFEKPEDATKAVVEMNNKMLGSKPLYVALAQRKEDRKAQLASQYMQRLAAMRIQNNVASNVYAPSTGGYFVPAAMQGNRQGYGMPAQQIMSGTQIRNSSLRWSNNMSGGYNPMQSSYPYLGGVGGQQRFQRSMGPVGQNRPRGYGQQQFPRSFQNQQLMRQSGQPMHPGHQQPMSSGIEPLNSQVLASVDPAEQKQMIAERIFPHVLGMCSGYPVEVVHEISNEVLQHDNAELLVMLEDALFLQSKVKEAYTAVQSRKKESA